MTSFELKTFFSADLNKKGSKGKMKKIVIKYGHLKNITPSEIHKTHTHTMLLHTQNFQMLGHEFKNGRENVEDDPRPG